MQNEAAFDTQLDTEARAINQVAESQTLPSSSKKTSPNLVISDGRKSNEKNDRSKNPRTNSKINWAKFNWPFCCGIIHYNLSEIDKRIRWVFTCSYISFNLLFMILIIKLIISLFYIISPEYDIFRNTTSEKVGIFIWTAVITFIMFFLKIACFYSAYRGFFYDSQFKFPYKVIQLVFLIFLIFNAVSDQFIFHGMLMIQILDQIQKDGAFKFIFFMLCVEFALTCIYLIVAIISFIGFFVIEAMFDSQ